MIYWKDIKTVYLKEITEILRNKRIIITAFIIPLLIYPVIFFGMNWLQNLDKKKLENEGYKIAISENLTEISNFLRKESSVPVNIIHSELIPELVLDKEVDLGIEFDSQNGENRKLWLYFSGSQDRSIKARSEIGKLFNNHKFQWTKHFASKDLENPEILLYEPLVPELQDVASLQQKSGHKIGKILPFILILMLVGGCSFAAVDMIAGEKERGCFETILVSPISRKDVIIGKLLVVIVTGLIALLVNLLSMLLWLKLGIFKSADGLSIEFSVSNSSLFGVFVCLLPITIIFASVLILISAYAKSYQSGQTLLLPVTLVSMLPAATAALPGLKSDSFLVMIPIANVVVAMREMLEGSLKWWPMIVGNLVNLAAAVIILKAAITSLDKEGKLIGGSSREIESFKDLQKDPIRVASIGFVVVWLLFYYVFVPLQANNMVSGLALTLWGLILLSGLAIVRVQGLEYKKLLSFKKINWEIVTGTFLFQSGFLPIVIYLNTFVMKLMPIPKGWMESFDDSLTADLSVTTLFLLMALSPGICEEILFRGAILGTLRQRWKPWKSIVVSSLMFGFLHFSVYRLFATSVLGGAFGWMLIQTGSIYPGMIAHAWSNSIALLIVPKLDLEGLSQHWLLLGIPFFIAGIRMIQSGSEDMKNKHEKIKQDQV